MSLIFRIARLPIYLYILVAGVWGYYNYYAWQTDVQAPLLSELQSKKAEHTNLQAKNKKAEEFKKVREQKFREREELELKFREGAALIPSTPDIPQLIKSLADISDKVGLEFSEFRPGTAKSQEFLNILPIEVKLSGTYVQIMSFLDETAQLKRVATPKTVRLDNARPRGTASTLSADATIQVYSMDQAAGLASLVPIKGKDDGKKPAVPPKTGGAR
jgi:Tfp pilus assembly protein PilO